MSILEQVAEVQPLYPEAYRHIRVEGMQTGVKFEDWYKKACEREEAAVARTKNGHLQKRWYIPFP
jgi:hypothetical protein